MSIAFGTWMAPLAVTLLVFAGLAAWEARQPPVAGIDLIRSGAVSLIVWLSWLVVLVCLWLAYLLML